MPRPFTPRPSKRETEQQREIRLIRAEQLYQKRFAAGADAARRGKSSTSPFTSYAAKVAWEEGYHSIKTT